VERRVILFIVLTLLVIALPVVLFPPKPAVRRSGGPADTTLTGPTVTESTATRPTPSAPSLGSGQARPPVRPPARETPAETVWVTSPLYRLGFSTRGARLVWAELLQYHSFAPGDSGRHVQLVPPGQALLVHRLVVGSDTASLADLAFTASARAVQVGQTGQTLTFTARRGGAQAAITYTFDPAEYRFGVRGHVIGLSGSGAVLVVGLGDGFRSVEADTLFDYREFAVVTKAAKTQKTAFGALKPGDRATLAGPFEWVAIKSKYFFAAALALEENQPQFGGVVVVGGERPAKVANRAAVWVTLPVPPGGDFRYDVYVGPLEHRRLAALGHGLDDANPYGWSFFRPIIHPVSLGVVAILTWMHDQLRLAYGWVLIFFGILVRLLLWPLNQKAMASQLRMQAAAPLLKDAQERYKDNPEKLQKEMMRIYKEYNVNPFGGCLPMFLPLPVLFALFFVFANTIEFRGVPFLWLPDLSRADPYFIIPVVMGLSMFAVSKVGQIGMPPNPQTKMLLYFMPAFLTFVFLRFASGLNLYYTVQNLVSIPQQYFLAKRRLRERGKA